jgi:hypothetical protein
VELYLHTPIRLLRTEETLAYLSVSYLRSILCWRIFFFIILKDLHVLGPPEHEKVVFGVQYVCMYVCMHACLYVRLAST